MSSENITPKEKYFEILELNPNASFSEIKSAYTHLKKLYSSNSPVLSTIIDDITEHRRKDFLARIEEAYRVLKETYSHCDTEKMKKNADVPPEKNIPEFEVFSGNALKLTREVLGIELQEISLATGIPVRHLQCIESERFEMLPPRGYVYIYVSKYAEYLSLDPKHVADDYIKALDKKKPKHERDRF